MHFPSSADFVGTIVFGFAFGLGFAVATWVVGLVLSRIGSRRDAR